MPATDVIFRIGTVGVSKATAEFAAVVAALYKIGAELKRTYDAAAVFADRWEALGKTQRDAVMALDRDTKGMISVNEAMGASAKLAAAKVDISSEALAAMGKIAVATGKAAGEGPEGMTARFNKMTDSLIKGNDRGLKPFGILMQANGTLTEKQADAMAQMIKRAGELSVDLSDLDDQMDSLSSRASTGIGLWWAWAKQTDIFGTSISEASDKIARVNAVTAESGAANLEYVNSISTVTSMMSLMGRAIGDTINPWVSLAEAQDRAKASWDRWVSGYQGAVEKGKSDEDEKAARAAQAARLATGGGAYGTPEAILDFVAPEKKKPPSGGGRPKKPKKGSTEDLLAGYGQLPEGAYTSVADILPGMTEEEQQSALDFTEQLSMTTQEMYTAELDKLRSIAEVENERLNYLTAKKEIDVTSLSTAEKIELWTIEEQHAQQMIEYEAQRMEYFARERTWYQDLMEAGKQFGKEDEFRKSIMTKGWAMASGAAGTYMNAVWHGSKSAGEAVRKMISETMEGISIEYGVKALVELAEAIISAAREDYGAAAKHAAASAQCAVVSAAAATAALGLNAIGGGKSKGKPPPSGASAGMGSSAYEGGGYGKKDEGPTEIIVHVDGSLASLVSQVTAERKRQKKSGAWDGGW